MKGGATQDTVPTEVVELSFECGISAMATRRENFGLAQTEVVRPNPIHQAPCKPAIRLNFGRYNPSALRHLKEICDADYRK